MWTLRMRAVEPTAAKLTDGFLRQKAVADLESGWTKIETCHLAEIDEEVIGSFRFKPLVSTTPTPIHRQAVSEGAMATLVFTSRSKLLLTSYDDAQDVKEVPLPCTATGDEEETCSAVHLVNRALQEDEDHEARCSGLTKGREFERYYGMAETSPLLFRQVVPHFTGYGRNLDLQPKECPGLFLKPLPNIKCTEVELRNRTFVGTRAVSGRPICTLVVFD